MSYPLASQPYAVGPYAGGLHSLTDIPPNVDFIDYFDVVIDIGQAFSVNIDNVICIVDDLQDSQSINLGQATYPIVTTTTVVSGNYSIVSPAKMSTKKPAFVHANYEITVGHNMYVNGYANKKIWWTKSAFIQGTPGPSVSRSKLMFVNVDNGLGLSSKLCYVKSDIYVGQAGRLAYIVGDHTSINDLQLGYVRGSMGTVAGVKACVVTNNFTGNIKFMYVFSSVSPKPMTEYTRLYVRAGDSRTSSLDMYVRGANITTITSNQNMFMSSNYAFNSKNCFVASNISVTATQLMYMFVRAVLRSNRLMFLVASPSLVDGQSMYVNGAWATPLGNVTQQLDSYIHGLGTINLYHIMPRFYVVNYQGSTTTNKNMYTQGA